MLINAESLKIFVSILQLYGDAVHDNGVIATLGSTVTDHPYPSSGSGSKIVNGHQVKVPHSYPYQVSLQYFLPILGNWYHYCGGSILNANTIITAAHCIRGFEKVKLRIGAGDHDLSIVEGNEQKIVFPIENVHVHPLYNSSTIDYDFAVIKLPQLLKLRPGIVEPIKLVDAEHPADQECVSTGWGNTDGSGGASKFPVILQEVITPIVDQEVCAANYSTIDFEITSRMICAGGPPGQDAGNDYEGICQGDSGGPLACKTAAGVRRLVGLSSFSTNPCGQEFPAGYARVMDQLDWIKEFLN